MNAIINRLLPFMEKHVPPKNLWFGIRFRRHTAREHGAFQRRFIKKVYGEDNLVVLSGPFRGMRYFDATFFGPVTPRWLGSYEDQLHPILECVIARAYPIIIDIGSAEGYFSVGLARLLPQSRVYSFDTDPISRRQQKRLMKLNGVNNLTLGSFCHWEDFNRIANDRTFAFIDIDNCEFTFLRPEKCKALARTDLLVEIHEGFGLKHEAFREEIAKRFEPTHDISVIRDAPKDIKGYRACVTGRLSDSDIEEAVKEYRAIDQSWIWLQSKLLSEKHRLPLPLE
jgi:hypothetical protein